MISKAVKFNAVVTTSKSIGSIGQFACDKLAKIWRYPIQMELNMQVTKPKLKLMVSVLLTAVLSGCVSNSKAPSYYQPESASVRYVSANVAHQLSDARENSVIKLEDTPLGSNVDVQVIRRYFAASGLNCVALQAQPHGQQLTACRHNTLDWFWSRSFNQLSQKQEQQ